MEKNKENKGTMEKKRKKIEEKELWKKRKRK